VPGLVDGHGSRAAQHIFGTWGFARIIIFVAVTLVLLFKVASVKLCAPEMKASRKCTLRCSIFVRRAERNRDRHELTKLDWTNITGSRPINNCQRFEISKMNPVKNWKIRLASFHSW